MKPFLIILLTSLMHSFGVAQNVNVTFRVDMNAETVSPNGVHIAGSFQSIAGLGDNWNPGSTILSDANADGIYEITVSLPPGTYEYKFINGNAWGSDENPPSACSIGPNNNRELTVGNLDLLLPVVPFDGCIVTLRLSVNMTGHTISPDGVHVMGDFQQAAGFNQNWDPTSIAMTDLNKDGTYEVLLIMPFGNYQYLFVNGNNNIAAEDLPVDCTVLGSNGTQNRVLNYQTVDDEPDTYCFNRCDKCHPSVVFDYDTYWWNDAVFYEIFVRSFYDSDGNGIGDFNGLTEKLDYLNDGNPETHDDLGITGIWLMPMMKSPSYHGYDVDNYYLTEPDYGTMQDFENFLDAAHQRGIKVIIDLVMNHASSGSAWFTQSILNTGGYRDWFIWSDTDPGTIGPWGQKVWHQANGDYYYGLFWSGMPDLNYRHLPVKEEMFKVVDFWLDKNVDGYRLDAIKYLYEDGNVLENLPETFELLEELNDVYKANNPDAFTIGEVWSSTEIIIPYVQEDRLDACFEFGLAGAIIDAVNNSDPDNLEEQFEKVLNSYPLLQYGTFLTNHDVDRVFSTLGSNVDKMKLAASLYLTLPGIPFLYYGEEVGMIGTGDHHNLRRPMQWADQTHGGFSSVTPWYPLGGNFHTHNVEDMDADPNSLLNHYRKLIRIRNDQQALRQGHTLQMEDNSNWVFSFARLLDTAAVFVVSNTSTTPVYLTLSLEFSSLDQGEYYVTELLTNQSRGKIMIDENGGFSGWQGDLKSILGRTAWVLSVSRENPVTSVSESVNSFQIKVTPNPASGSFQISLDQNVRESASVQVFNSTGQLQFNGKMDGNQMTIKTAGWTAGIYYVQVTGKYDGHIGKAVVTIQ